MRKLLLCCALLTATVASAGDAIPRYKPSSQAPEALDITSNAYGFSRTAPDALKIGDTAPDFTLAGPKGVISLAELRRKGEVAVIFYRGHW